MHHDRQPTPSTFHLRSGAFTLLELMLVILIMSIVSVICLDAVSSFEANQRSDRAAREALAFFRYARALALTTGKNAEVVISGATFSVYWMSNGTTFDATPLATSSNKTGQWILNLNNSTELVGTSVAVTPAATASFIYNSLGSCLQSATITFTYAGRTKSLIVPNVGDPAVQ
jgi:prepilin-type N-terminal cleavage/methylation domain-containing protein